MCLLPLKLWIIKKSGKVIVFLSVSSKQWWQKMWNMFDWTKFEQARWNKTYLQELSGKYQNVLLFLHKWEIARKNFDALKQRDLHYLPCSNTLNILLLFFINVLFLLHIDLNRKCWRLQKWSNSFVIPCCYAKCCLTWLMWSCTAL